MWKKYAKDKAMKITSKSGIYQIQIIVVANYCYLQRENDYMYKEK